MKKIINNSFVRKAIILVYFLLIFFPINLNLLHAENSNLSAMQTQVATNLYCQNGGDVSYDKFVEAKNAGLIIFSEIDKTSSTASVHITNQTGCTIPMSLSSYKMFDQVLSHQQIFDNTGLVHVGASADLSVDLANCMSQVDFWFGEAPINLLDSNPYWSTNPPIVLHYAFTQNSGTGYGDASGNFCVLPTNKPPVITLVGSNPMTITIGTTFVDPGATATDPEQGDLTSSIVKTGTVNSSAVGTYTLTYKVTDNGGLSDTVTRTVNVVPAQTNECSALIIDTFVTPQKLTEYGFGIVHPVLQVSVSTGDDLGGELDVFESSVGDGNTIINSIGNTHFSSNHGPSGKGVTTLVWDGVDHDAQHINYTGLSGIDLTDSGKRDAITFNYSSDFVNNAKVPVTITVYSDSTHASSITLPLYEVISTELTARVEFSDFTPILGGGANFTHVGAITLAIDTNSRTGHDFSIGNIKVSCGTPIPPVNHPPVITLVGSNPMTVTVGTAFTDPGATASDPEDGPLTPIVTGSVNNAVVGTYTLTYTATDSKGLSASITRTVNVVPAQTNECSALIIDTFVTPQKLTDYGSGVDHQILQISLPTGDDLGGELDIFESSVGDGDTVINSLGNTHLSSNHGPYGMSTTTLVWDGVDHDATHINYTGLNSIDLTAGGKRDAITFNYSSDFVNNAKVPVTITVYTDATHASRVTLPLYGAFSTELVARVEFSNFTPILGTGADFTHVGAITLAIDTHSRTGHDFSIGNIKVSCGTPVTPVNKPPVITLVGSNPMTITIGTTFVDPGATATDPEQGDLTSSIVKTGTVNSSAVGTYTLTYKVTDNGGLSDTVTRTVNVVPVVEPNPGKINVCMVFADYNNVIATTSNTLPSGTFSLKLATTTNYDLTNVFSHTWNTNSISVNKKTILSENDSDCLSVDNLPLGTYLYSELATTGPRWDEPKYNDQFSHPVNNTFDFFNYSKNGSEVNSDGKIILDSSKKEATLIMYATYKKAPEVNTPPTITLVGNNPLNINLGQTFVDPGATANDLEDGIITEKIATTSTVNINVLGTYLVTYSVTDTGGLSTSTTRTVIVNPVTCTSNCGGGSSSGANLSVTKNVDKATANVGDTLIYQIKVVNNGPEGATGVKVTDILPTSLTFVSATSTYIGTYSTTTNIWDIGDLANNASTTLTIITTVNTGTSGQKITNTATVNSNQTDPDPSNNQTSVDTTIDTPVVPPPACTSNCGGGGGGGGGGPIIQSLTIFNEQVLEITPGIATVTWNTNLPATRKVVYGNSSVPVLGSSPLYGYTTSTQYIDTPLLTVHSMTVVLEPGVTYYFRPVSSDSSKTVLGKELTITRGQVVGASTSNSCYYLYDYLRRDFQNNPVEVKKLQVFLNSFEGENLVVNGIYDDATEKAVDNFQNKYSGDILTPWGHTAPTGYTYILTKKKVNEIYCQKAFPVTAQQQNEIDTFRTFLQNLNNAGVRITPDVNVPPVNNPEDLGNVVGQNETGGKGTNTQTTLAAVSTTTKNIANSLVANVISSGKKLGNYMLAFFTWPVSLIKDAKNLCEPGLDWFSWLLIAIIIIISILWYREYRNNRKIEIINKEIDLEK